MSLKNIRSHRIFGLAIFDIIIALIGTISIFLLFWKIHYSELYWWKFVIAAVILTIPLGIFFHVLFGVNTQLNYDLGLSNKPKEGKSSP